MDKEIPGKRRTVLCLAQVGLPVRGVSPYSDSLLWSLQQESEARGDWNISVMDFASAMPGALYPGGSLPKAKRIGVAWWNPVSWFRVARTSGQVIHLQYWNPVLSIYFIFIFLICKMWNKVTIVTVHNPEPHEQLRLLSLFEQVFFRVSDVLVVHGKVGAAVLRQRLGNSKISRIRVIPHGIKIQSSPRLDREVACNRLGLSSELRYVCMFGNLRGYKGVDTLLEAWREVERDVPNVVLVLAGRLWGEGSGLKALVSRALGLRREAQRIRHALSLVEDPSRLKLMDRFLDDEEIDALLSLSSFAVFPYTKFSSQSGAASRAAGWGCPVLVARVGELPDLAVSDDWIVSPGNAKDLADTIKQNLERGCDSRRMQTEQALNFEWSRIARFHLNMYSEVVHLKAQA